MAPLALALASGCEEKNACAGGVTADISGNHGHSLAIPADAVKRGIGGTYPLQGGSHEHAVPVKDADFEKLQGGGTATTRSTSVEGHTHEITLSCAPSG